MNNWPEIVAEQFRHLGRLQRSIGIRLLVHVSCSVTPPAARQHPLSWIAQCARINDLSVHIEAAERTCERCETPAILILEAIAKKLDGYILYLHGKGVAHPNSLYRTLWRYHMNTYCLRKVGNLWHGLPPNVPWLGAVASDSPVPHSCGNYFLADAAHLRSLPDFMTYRATFFNDATPKWFELRHADEMWLGSTKVRGVQLGPIGHQPQEPSWWASRPDIQRYVIQHGS